MRRRPKAEARRRQHQVSQRTWKVKLWRGRTIEIRQPSGKTVIRWLTGAATLAAILESLAKVFRGR